MEEVLVKCEFCGTVGDFFQEDFDQVVIKYERNQDWNGDYAICCPICAIAYREGLCAVTTDERVGVSPEEVERVVLCYSYQNYDPLFKVYLMGKPTYREGERWVRTDEKRELERRLKSEFESAFEEKNGMTVKEWEKQWTENELKRGRITPAFVGRAFQKIIKE